MNDIMNADKYGIDHNAARTILCVKAKTLTRLQIPKSLLLMRLKLATSKELMLQF